MATTISIGVEPSAVVQKHKPDDSRPRRSRDIALEPAPAHSVLRLDAHGKPCRAVRWTRPADAQPGDYLYAPPSGLTDAEQIAWCMEHWQPVLIAGEDKFKSESPWWDGKENGHHKHDPNIHVHFDTHDGKRPRRSPEWGRSYAPHIGEDGWAPRIGAHKSFSKPRYKPVDPFALFMLDDDGRVIEQAYRVQKYTLDSSRLLKLDGVEWFDGVKWDGVELVPVVPVDGNPEPVVLRCESCQVEVTVLGGKPDKHWLCGYCDISPVDSHEPEHKHAQLIDDPYSKMVAPALPERDQKRADIIEDYWRTLRTKTSFNRKDLLEDPDFREDLHEYEVIFEGMTLGDKATQRERERRRQAMDKELQHICPKNVCPDNCCQLDGENSAFTHAFYAATTTDETRLQVCRGGFFAVVMRDVYRIYSLGPLGTPHDVIDEVYDKLWDDSKAEAIHAAHKKAKRDGLGVRDTQRAETDAAIRADKAFEDGIIHEVQPADPSTVCPTCGKPLTGFFTFHDDGLDNPSVTA